MRIWLKPDVMTQYRLIPENATTVNREIDAFLTEASENLPKGIAIEQLMSSNSFLFAAIRESFCSELTFLFTFATF
jgi:hypothetical protein